MNNSTIFTADRTTHLKIVVISLVASILVIVVGIAARTTTTTADATTTSRIQTAGPAVKAGKPMAITHSDTSAIR
jgi:ABC-type proline/glycine betaine transport system permease subunit